MSTVDDVVLLCTEIAEAMYKENVKREPTRFLYEWDELPSSDQMLYYGMARIAMEMIGIHMKIQIMEGLNDASN